MLGGIAMRPKESELRDILDKNKVIAIVGLSPKAERDSNMVARYLQAAGYEIIPVNPAVDEVLGCKSYPTLKDIPKSVDIVDVFRRPEHTPAVAAEAAQVGAKVLWLQEGVHNQEACDLAMKAGMQVVSDLCIKVEHMRLGQQ